MLKFAACTRKRLLAVGILTVALPCLYALAAKATPSIGLPPFFEPDDALEVLALNLKQKDSRMEVGAMIYGGNNVSPLLRIDRDGQSPHQVGDGSRYAILSGSSWVRVSRNRWWLEAGTGLRDTYQANPDAGQLWIDLHAKGQTRSSYSPFATYAQISATWYAVGYTFPFGAGAGEAAGAAGCGAFFGTAGSGAGTAGGFAAGAAFFSLCSFMTSPIFTAVS